MSIRYATGAFVVSGGRVLLIHHRKLGYWTCPGGHVESDETPEDCVVRETLEETGVNIVLVGHRPEIERPGVRHLIPPRWMTHHTEGPLAGKVCMTWLARPAGTQAGWDARLVEPQNHLAIGWFGKDAIPVESPPDVRAYAQAALYDLREGCR